MQNTVIRAIFVAINGLIFIGSIILNLLAIVYILSTRDKTTISILVVNLAIADIIHAMGIIFFSSNLFTRSWIFGEFGCKFSLTTDVLCTVVIVYTVAALSIERYIDARSTLTAKFRSLVTFASLVLIWTLGLLVSYPFIFYTYLLDTSSNTTKNSTVTATYSCQSHLTERELLVHEIVLYVIAFLIPYSIIVLFSLKLLKFLRSWLKRKEKLTRTSVSRKRTRGVKLVLCIVLSFLICYTPFWAFKFYTRFIVDENVLQRPILQRILSYVHLLVVLLNHFESVLNPLFFIVLTERFCITFSKHRERHSRLFGPSSAILLAGGKKSTKTATSTLTSIARNTETNSLLTFHNNHVDIKHKLPVVVQSL
ncbi:unnamed protein product [Adineta steineri]|uniref:G-protein coupled receptors family 1 profile domain-containing protein n=1 Tax=Adineta steineri TaxID=433720 RepID=A0A815HRP9_9BILA|nr:unnamed protein product [Adineta steineri]CAF1356200.1 unnamed protein product [Adineta steineri]CAF1364091.1 unnamed protein product [Adineta steineri]CAF3805377.1 unnamed protein product [Adineta steineri]CAF3831805.1 unnamed protein product [Adineta steineri]